jgi:hypothetical protein
LCRDRGAGLGSGGHQSVYTTPGNPLGDTRRRTNSGKQFARKPVSPQLGDAQDPLSPRRGAPSRRRARSSPPSSTRRSSCASGWHSSSSRTRSSPGSTPTSSGR